MGRAGPGHLRDIRVNLGVALGPLQIDATLLRVLLVLGLLPFG